MGSGNWIVDNLNSALQTWNDKLAEIWTLISTTPEEFKGGGIWNVIVSINGALQAIGYALLVLFFVMGVVKTCGSFTEIKRPEVAFKCFIRFVLAQAAVTYGMELMNALFRIAQGAVSTIMDASGMTAMSPTTLPEELITAIESVGLLESIPLWAVTLLGSLFIWVLSLIMILTVYSRFFKLYMATAIAPIPLSSFAGQPSSSISVAFLKSYAAICLEGFQYAGAGRLDQDERPDHPGIDGAWLIIVKQVIHLDLISSIRFWFPIHLCLPHTVEHDKFQHLVLPPPEQNATDLPNQGDYPGQGHSASSAYQMTLASV